MGRHPYWLVPSYYPQFECKMGRCRASCCTGWPISVSSEDYFRLLGTSCSIALRRRLDRALRLQLHPTTDAYAEISPTYEGECPLRLEDGRCWLHAELGGEALSLVCRLYPRGPRELGERECSCANSCEVVLELLFAQEEPMGLTRVPQRFKLPKATPPVNVFETLGLEQEIRLWLIRLMQDRRYHLPERIMRMGRALHEMDEALTAKDRPRVLRLLKCEEYASPGAAIAPLPPSVQRRKEQTKRRPRQAGGGESATGAGSVSATGAGSVSEASVSATGAASVSAARVSATGAGSVSAASAGTSAATRITPASASAASAPATEGTSRHTTSDVNAGEAAVSNAISGVSASVASAANATSDVSASATSAAGMSAASASAAATGRNTSSDVNADETAALNAISGVSASVASAANATSGVNTSATSAAGMSAASASAAATGRNTSSDVNASVPATSNAISDVSASVASATNATSGVIAANPAPSNTSSGVNTSAPASSNTTSGVSASAASASSSPSPSTPRHPHRAGQPGQPSLTVAPAPRRGRPPLRVPPLTPEREKALRTGERLLARASLASNSIRPYGESALSCLCGGSDMNSRLPAAATRFERRFPRWEIMFEQMLVNHMFFTRFPFQDRPVSLREEFVALCAVYALLRLLSLGWMWGHSGQDALVDVCAAAFRMIEHTSFDRFSVPVVTLEKADSLECLEALVSL